MWCVRDSRKAGTIFCTSVFVATIRTMVVTVPMAITMMEVFTLILVDVTITTTMALARKVTVTTTAMTSWNGDEDKDTGDVLGL